MITKIYQAVAVITGFTAILWLALEARAASPPYAAPVIREAAFGVRNRQLEVTLKGVFHAGTKTAVARCEPFLPDTTFNSRQVQVIRKVRADDDDAPRGISMAEAAKIMLPLFLTGPKGVECVFTLRDEEPSSKPAEQRTSAPLRTRLVTDNLPDIEKASAADPTGVKEPASGPNTTCEAEDETIGADGLPPVDPAAVVVVGDIVFAGVKTPITLHGGGKPDVWWYAKDGLDAPDFDIFAVHGSERKKLTVDRNDFSRELSPLSIGVLTDSSGSMRSAIFGREPGTSETLTKRSLAEASASRVLSTALKIGMRYVPPKDPKGRRNEGSFKPLSDAFVMNFNEDFILNGEENPGIHAGHFVQDEARLKSWITGKAAGGIVLRYGTRLLDAVYRAAYEMNRVAAQEVCHPNPRVEQMRNEMEKRREAEGRNSYTFQENYALKQLLEEVATVKRRRVLFVISDGLDNRSKLKLDTVVEYLSKSGVVVYGINYVNDAEEAGASVLPDLAQATGGQAMLINLALGTTSIQEKVNEFTYAVLSALEHEYELTFEETLQSCSKLEMHAFDTSKLGETWLDMEKTYKRLTCQVEPPRPEKPKTESKPDDGGVKITGSEPEEKPEKPACVPDPHASLVPWAEYYFAHYRDKDIPELQVNHRSHIGPCSPAEIRALNDGKATTKPPARPRGK